jgi:RNA polymerase sporulation-specific sigma factor
MSKRFKRKHKKGNNARKPCFLDLLVLEWQSNQDELLFEVLFKYTKSAREAVAAKYNWLDQEELKSMFHASLLEAAQKYKVDKGMKFNSFYSMSIIGDCKSLYTNQSGRRWNAKAGKYTQTYRPTIVSLSEPVGDSYLEDVIPAIETSPEPSWLDCEHNTEMATVLVEAMTPFESEVWKLRIDDKSHEETAKALKCSPKAVDNAMTRIKARATNILAGKRPSCSDGKSHYVPKVKVPFEQAFWDKVTKLGINDCWAWKGCKDTRGQPQFRYMNQWDTAMRVAWRLTGREVPKGHYIRRSCKNNGCVNPNHGYIVERTTLLTR